MRVLLFWYVMQRGLIVSYGRYETTYQSHLEASSSQKKALIA